MLKSRWTTGFCAIFCMQAAFSDNNEKSFIENNIHKRTDVSRICVKGGCISINPDILSDLENDKIITDITLSKDAQIYIDSEESIKKNWSLVFAESVIKQRISSHLKNHNKKNCVYTNGKNFFPSFSDEDFVGVFDEESDDLIKYPLDFDILMEESVDLSELNFSKESILDALERMIKEDKSEEEIIAYKLIESVYKDYLPSILFEDFLKVSYEMIKNMTAEDVDCALEELFKDINNPTQDFSIDELVDDAFQENNSFLLGDSYLSGTYYQHRENSKGFSSLKKGLSSKDNFGTNEDFESLRLTSTDRKIIKKIITNLSDKNVFQLLLDKKSMEKMGKQIRPVHPLRFIGFILSDPSLKKSLKSITGTYFKWKNFVEGFEDRMKEEALNNNLYPYLKGFSDQLGVDPKNMAKYIYNKDYEGLLRYFL